jgi:hypothetical protein
MNPWDKPPRIASANALDPQEIKGIYRAKVPAEG